MLILFLKKEWLLQTIPYFKDAGIGVETRGQNRNYSY
jgi:hypothetical protein